MIEFPKVSFEKDILSILGNEKYVPNYEGGHGLIEKIGEMKLNRLYADSQMISDALKSRLRNSFELNSIGYVLLDQGEKENLSLFIASIKTCIPTRQMPGMDLPGHISHLIEKKRQDPRLKSKSLDPNNEETKQLLQRVSDYSQLSSMIQDPTSK